MDYETINPADETVIDQYVRLTPNEIDARLDSAAAAFRGWSRTPVEARARHVGAIATVLRRRSEELARLMTNEMGKPIGQSRSEIDKCAWVCEYYSENGSAFLEDEPVDTDADNSFVAYLPLGPVLAVMPWNFPFWQVFRFAAPALVAGNVGLLKHAENVSGCALAIESVIREAGLPDNTFSSLLIDHDLAAKVIEDDRVRAVTLTGSTRAGRSVAATAGSALKKTVLELGGSDPYLVLEDADIEMAAGACVTSRLINSGQSCIAAKRFIVVDSVADTFTAAFVDRMKASRMGDPLAEDVEVGPQARGDLREELQKQVSSSVAAGARCILGGSIPDGKGFYYPPTVLTDVSRGMPAYEEEMFGPVAAVIRADNEAHAVELANDSSFGLGAAVFTRDAERGLRIARDELEAGCCFVNAFVKSDPRLPFGGVKQSGYGRELSRQGIREFVNVKSIYSSNS